MKRTKSQADQDFDDEQSMDQLLRHQTQAITIHEIAEIAGMSQSRIRGALERLSVSGGALHGPDGWRSPWPINTKDP